MSKTSAAAAGFILAFFASWLMANYTVYVNRRHLEELEKKGEALSEAKIQWSILHIRDDIGAIYNFLIIANGLLAGILGALLF
jgi:hypothetical protein